MAFAVIIATYRLTYRVYFLVPECAQVVDLDIVDGDKALQLDWTLIKSLLPVSPWIPTLSGACLHSTIPA